MAKKPPNPIDIHVGARVRMRRIMISMSQEKLGAKLGITFQQIQKYEKGTNRIGASRLQQTANVLGVPISFFFEGAPGENVGDPKAAAYITEFLATANGLALVKAFSIISDSKVRRGIVRLVQSIAGESGAD